MRTGILVTLIGLVLLNAAMWFTKPSFDPGFPPSSGRAEAMTSGLESWAFQRPLGAHVYSLSWRKWYGEAYEGQKPDSGGTSSMELGHLMQIGASAIERRMVLMTAASFGGAAVAWGIVAFFGRIAKKMPTGRGANWLLGRLTLLLLAAFLACLAGPAVVAEDAPGLLFSVPLMAGLVTAFVLRKKAAPAAASPL